MSSKIIAIGAVGGSGTRAVAEVLIQSGIYTGDDLNISNDNLVFTRLFKNPSWYQSANRTKRRQRFRIFQKYMTGTVIQSEEVDEFQHAAETNTLHPSDDDYIQSLANLEFEDRDNPMIWGWKEPNTQIYIRELLTYFPDLKYIHVIRHGLDMAFSANKNQLRNWGWKFGIHVSDTDNETVLAQKQLEYWIRSTKYVLEETADFQNRVMILKYDAFCNDPINSIDAILSFCGLDLSLAERTKLYTIPKNTRSANRYKTKDLSIFKDAQLAFVDNLGFSIMQ